jgi:phosphoserine phosphatase
MEIPCKALLFDLDRTLINNIMVHHRAGQKKLKLQIGQLLNWRSLVPCFAS